jgi:predicted ArsR family transcriptional regulator
MDELQAVGDPELRDALLFARRQASPVTADELAAAQGIHRNVARFRLERLAEAGLLEVGFERRSGRSGPGAGRPAKIYAVAPQLSAVEFPQRRTEALLGHLLDALPSRGRAEALRAVGEAFAADLAEAGGLKKHRTLRSGALALCAAVRRLGYQASLEEVDGNRAVIATPTCPLRPFVREHPAAVDIDRAMWAGLLRRSVVGADATQVSCETCDCLDDHASCKVVFRLGRM